MPESSDKLQDRLMQEIDACSAKLEELSKVVVESTTLLRILSRILFCIVLAVITGSIAFGFSALQTRAEIQALKKIESQQVITKEIK